RLALRGREVPFMLGLLRGCEIIAYVTGLAYAGGMPIWGNPNSLGAVVGGVLVPFLLWGLLIASTRSEKYRYAIALGIAGILLYISLSRAGMLAAAVGSLTMLIALRRQRLLIKGAFVVVTFLAFAAVAQPAHFADLVDTFTSRVIHKGR